MESIDSGSRRQTGNRAWPKDAQGVIGRDIANTAVALKGLIQRSMNTGDVEEANRLCNSIIDDAQRVEGLEGAAGIGGSHAS
jgi:hypothetical protein